MIAKIAVCLLGLFFSSTNYANSSSDFVSLQDKHYVEAFFLIMTAYSIIISSLYFISYPMGEHLANVPVHMAYILLRILVGFYLVSCYHLYVGLTLEFQAIDYD